MTRLFKTGDKVEYNNQPYGVKPEGLKGVVERDQDGIGMNVLVRWSPTSIGYHTPSYLRLLSSAPAPTLDLTKPVQTRGGIPARIICTDRVTSGYGKPFPVVALVGHPNSPEIMSYHYADGTSAHGLHGDEHNDLVNVPTPKETRTFELVMHRSNRNGLVVVGKHEIGWQPHENTVLARKTITIEEGEGM